jgi:hypothetical protein
MGINPGTSTASIGTSTAADCSADESGTVVRPLVFAKAAATRLAERIPAPRRLVAAGAVVAMVVGPASIATASSHRAPARAAVVRQHAAAPSTPSSAKQAPAAAAAAAAAAQTAATPVASSSAAAKSNPYQGSTESQLEPTGTYGGQEYFTPDSAQWGNARAITAVAEQRAMPVYAAVIAVATAIQESTLQNLTSAVNYDSLGLFQQRPSMGWGSAAELTDPSYAANAFLAAMQEEAPDYQQLSLWEAAQDTQRSGFPTAYAKWENQAAQMVQQLTD